MQTSPAPESQPPQVAAEVLPGISLTVSPCRACRGTGSTGYRQVLGEYERVPCGDCLGNGTVLLVNGVRP